MAVFRKGEKRGGREEIARARWGVGERESGVGGFACVKNQFFLCFLFSLFTFFFFFACTTTTGAIESNNKTLFSSPSPFSSFLSFPLLDPASNKQELSCGLSEGEKRKQRTPTHSDKHVERKTMAEEALDALELGKALNAAVVSGDAKPLTIADLPNDVLVTVFVAVDDNSWVRHTVPCVCKQWNELFRSKDASPLHETLEVDFGKEAAAAREGGARRRGGASAWWGSCCCTPAAASPPAAAAASPRLPVVHASRVISWAERHAGSVRKLRLSREEKGALDDFSAEDLGRLVSVVGSSLTEFSVETRCGDGFGQPFVKKPLWKALRDSVVPARRLRSLVVKGIAFGVSEDDIRPIRQLAGSLEVLELGAAKMKDRPYYKFTPLGLPFFPEFVCSLTNLRRLSLLDHPQITALPAAVSSLKKLKVLDLRYCRLASLPKELGKLSGLTKLDLSFNKKLGEMIHGRWWGLPDNRFPAELGGMTSLRELNLHKCRLYIVPAFIGALRSLEVLDLSENHLCINAPLDFLVSGCPRLRYVTFGERRWDQDSLEGIKAFMKKMRKTNKSAEVFCMYGSESDGGSDVDPDEDEWDEEEDDEFEDEEDEWGSENE